MLSTDSTKLSEERVILVTLRRIFAAFGWCVRVTGSANFAARTNKPGFGVRAKKCAIYNLACG
jgi:hypothetical protein